MPSLLFQHLGADAGVGAPMAKPGRGEGAQRKRWRYSAPPLSPPKRTHESYWCDTIPRPPALSTQTRAGERASAPSASPCPHVPPRALHIHPRADAKGRLQRSRHRPSDVYYIHRSTGQRKREKRGGGRFTALSALDSWTDAHTDPRIHCTRGYSPGPLAPTAAPQTLHAVPAPTPRITGGCGGTASCGGGGRKDTIASSHEQAADIRAGGWDPSVHPGAAPADQSLLSLLSQ